MEVLKFVILLCCLYSGFASHDAHTIPVENYETELQYLGEHVEVPETPVKVVKITKTVAVKVPVPYPVKIIEKVPYPVHINKPYPVPVPQIIKVPHVVTPNAHHEHEAIDGHERNQNLHLGGNQQGNAYQVQERHEQDEGPSQDSYEPEGQSYHGDNSEQNQNFAPYNENYSSDGASGQSYEGPSSYYGSEAPNDAESFESKSYDHAIRRYHNKVNPSGNNHNNYNYH